MESKQPSKNLSPAPALVLLCFPICQIGEIMWKGTVGNINSLLFGKLFRNLVCKVPGKHTLLYTGCMGELNGGRKFFSLSPRNADVVQVFKLMGNKQPEKKSPVTVPSCTGWPLSWSRSILFLKQRPKPPEIQHSVHRRSAVGDAYNYHPFLENYFLCRKWLFCGNALKLCNHVNPVPAVMVEMSILHSSWGSLWWHWHKWQKFWTRTKQYY